FPVTPFPVLDLIDTFGKSLRGRAPARIAVFATRATVRSGAYGRTIRINVPGADVFEIEAPALVPLVERGAAGTRVAQDAVDVLCRDLPPRLDAIVYGCTHYPLLDDAFAAALGSRVERMDPAIAQAAATKALLHARAMPGGTGTTHYLTNGDLGAFRRNVRSWTADARGTFADTRALTA
ncbi:MAG: glutamate racemase, partial [Candidatus Velthaea sp.]